jgi:hypothetical protein
MTYIIIAFIFVANVFVTIIFVGLRERECAGLSWHVHAAAALTGD